MRKKAVRIGVIKGGLLDGLRAELLHTNKQSFTVRLCEGFKAYQAGDVLNISFGDFTVQAASNKNAQQEKESA